VISSASQLRELLPDIKKVDRIALDTEADSLHCYREKLCLLQISIPGRDAIVDPLAKIDLQPLRDAFAKKEIVLHGADYDLRLLRRNMNFVPQRIFDTMIAARMIGQREFSLAALVLYYFGIELAKGSQKANWAQRPLSKKMSEYAINDTRYLLPLAERLELELKSRDRMEWTWRQSIANATSRTPGESPAPARCVDALPPSCGSCGSGANAKRKRSIVPRFTFCRTASCCTQPKNSLTAKRRTTNISHPDGVTPFATLASAV
jgi:ribonuclease D